MKKIFIASDHAGIELKSEILHLINSAPFFQKFEIHDLGPNSTDSVDYPDFADLVCKKIHGLSIIDTQHQNQSFPTEIGILICGSGQGMSMRANKYSHIRAALCWNTEVAKLSREHNNANILCLGARTVPESINIEILKIFLETPFLGDRHLRRVNKLSSPTS